MLDGSRIAAAAAAHGSVDDDGLSSVFDDPLPFIARVSDVLADSLDLERTLDRLVRLLVPALADVCSIHLLDDEDRLRRVAIQLGVPEIREFGDRLGGRYFDAGGPDSPVRRALASGQVLLQAPVSAESLGHLIDPAAARAIHDAVRPTSVMIVPLIARGRPIGVLGLATVRRPAFGQDHQGLALEVGRRAALAIDNGRLFEEACAATARLASERRLSDAIVQSVTEGILVANRQGLITYVNPGVEQMLGWKPKQLLGRHIHDALHVQDEAGTPMPRSTCNVGDFYVTGQRVYLNDLYFMRADGRVVPVAVTASPLFEDGEIVGGVSVVRDVSEPRRHREALRRSEERLRRALTSAGMAMWERDFVTGRTDRSDLAVTLYGRPRSELTDDPLDFVRLVHPDDRDATRATVDAAIARGEGYDLEYRSVRPDGTVRWLNSRASIFYDERGVARGLSGTTHDITDRKVAQLELRRLLEERQAEAAELRQLHGRLQRSLGALLGLHDVGRLLTSVIDPDATGSRLLEIALRAADLRAVALRRRDGRGALRVWKRAGHDRRARTAWRARTVAAARGRALAHGQPTTGAVDLADGGPRLTHWCIPLLVRGDVIGTLEALGDPRPAHELTREILGSIALQAATALENARLYREVADSEQALRRLVHQLMTAQEFERRRLANDIHDGLAQLALGAQQVTEAYAHQYPGDSADARRRQAVAVDLSRRTVSEIRRVLAGLRPSVLEDFGLERALKAHAESLDAFGLSVSFSGSLGPLRLDADVEIALFRVAQEALANVQKHAGVDHADLRLARLGNDVVLEISDDGRGFSPAATAGERPGEQLGLLSMSERVALVAGTLEIVSDSDAGTRIRACVPLVRAGEAAGRRRSFR